MTERQRRLLGQILKEHKALRQGEIQEALQIQREKGGQIGQILLGMGVIDREQLQRGLADQAGMPTVDLGALEIPEAVLKKVDPGTAQTLRVVPFKQEAGVLHIALADPLNTSVTADIEFMTGLKVRCALASDEEMDAAIKRYYAEEDEDLDRLVDAIEEQAKGIEDPSEMARSAPVVRLLNYILLTAIRDRSSDIHLEPFENEFKIRYRVDGTLFELRSPPQHLAVALISRVKVLANLNIAENRIPQDGRIDLQVEGRSVDIRVSTLPTLFGESCVMRILDRTVVSLELEKVGLRVDEAKVLRDLITRAHGVVLVTGPTGSGKTTTLYAALNAINDEAVKIITTEDPVEYDLDGVVQVQINDEIGLTYAACLRSILRQDPDKILVGEIRDQETAQIAVEAALTGHLVFSTLHTNDAPSAVTRMVDIGVEPYLLSATLEGIVAQRLVRRVCTSCREQVEPTDEALFELGLTREQVGNKRFSVGRGCELCHGTGYRGRLAIFELMVMNPVLARGIVEGWSAGRLQEKAREFGMRSLRESGILAVLDGLTTPEEVVRETLVSF